MTEPICELVRFRGRAVDGRDPKGSYGRAPLAVRKEVRDREVYDYVKVMP